jgi:CheY-like chemotaxis protein
MGDLIDDLLAFSRLERVELRKEDVNLDESVRATLGELEVDTKGRNIIWTIHPLPAVQADRALLRLVLVNLISNAVKFTGPRAEAGIEIGCAPGSDSETVICIRDNGAGFDPKYTKKLFGVFQRLHRHQEFEGTGIGLANVQRIIHRHGGRVWAEGVMDGGATFYFSVPKTAEAATGIKSLKTILLIEGNPQDVELTLAALDEHHLANKVAVVDNGAEGLDYLYRRGKFKMRTGGNPMVVFLADNTPKVSGLGVVKTMKADERLKSIPIVVLASSHDARDSIEFHIQGVNDYVVKPLYLSEFMKTVKQLGVV